MKFWKRCESPSSAPRIGPPGSGRGGLPSFLTFLYINDCSLLKLELQNKRGAEWYHIAHIKIDAKEIS
ncbi:hypothetical protein ACOSQ3_005069 [Xanthoceras sorbifolium]